MLYFKCVCVVLYLYASQFVDVFLPFSLFVCWLSLVFCGAARWALDPKTKIYTSFCPGCRILHWDNPRPPDLKIDPGSLPRQVIGTWPHQTQKCTSTGV